MSTAKPEELKPSTVGGLIRCRRVGWGRGRVGDRQLNFRGDAILDENALADVMGHARGEGRDQGEGAGARS